MSENPLSSSREVEPPGLAAYLARGLGIAFLAALALAFCEIALALSAPAPLTGFGNLLGLVALLVLALGLFAAPAGLGFGLVGFGVGRWLRRSGRRGAPRTPQSWVRTVRLGLGALGVLGCLAVHVVNALEYVRLYHEIHRLLSAAVFLGLNLSLLLLTWGAPLRPAGRGVKIALLSIPVFLAGAVAGMHLLLTQREALKAFVFERTTALVHCLEILKRAADWDGDGYTALLGGGDCDEGDPHRHPAAREVVGNGIDENCSGADLSAADVETAHRELAPEMAGGPAPRPPRPWNVLLLTVDALRFDRLDPARGPVLAPHLWRAQRAGVTFERAYAVSSWTNAAVYALLTSRFPSQVRWTPIAISSNDEILVDRRPWSAIRGLLEHKKRMPAPIFDRTPTFPEILRRAGYLTATFPSYLFFLRNVGLTRGFEVNDSSPYHALRRAGGGPEARLVTDRLLPLLTRAVREGRPFFAWVHYMDPHGPFPPGTGLSREEGYDRAVFAADAQVGRVLAWLETAQLASRTLVILSSDHGEEFRDHGGEYHGTTLYEEVLRAPVTFLVPGAPPRAVGGTVSHIDLLPTVLDLLGQPRPPGLMGRSLAPWLEGRAGDPPLRPVLAETYRFEAEKRALFDGAHKLILDRKHNTAELYDLQADPLELQNLVDDQPARAAGMRARLWRYLGALELDAPPDEEHARDQ